MTRSVVRPQFPVAPPQYSSTYMAEVVRAFSVFLNQVQNPGDLRATNLVLTDLPSSDSGLEVGAVFNFGGYLKISASNTPHPAGLSVVGSVGSVTVTIV
jgi:hypothetical protein